MQNVALEREIWGLLSLKWCIFVIVIINLLPKKEFKYAIFIHYHHSRIV